MLMDNVYQCKNSFQVRKDSWHSGANACVFISLKCLAILVFGGKWNSCASSQIYEYMFGLFVTLSCVLPRRILVKWWNF